MCNKEEQKEKQDNDKCAWCDKFLNGSLLLCSDCLQAITMFREICIEETKIEFFNWEEILVKLTPVMLKYFKEMIKTQAMHEMVEKQQKVKEEAREIYAEMVGLK